MNPKYRLMPDKGVSKSVALNIILVMVCAALLLIVFVQRKAIRTQQEVINDWEGLSVKWRESMDTCMNRNDRLWDELNSLREYKIMKLREEQKQ